MILVLIGATGVDAAGFGAGVGGVVCCAVLAAGGFCDWADTEIEGTQTNATANKNLTMLSPFSGA